MKISFLSPAVCMICGTGASPQEMPVCDLCLYKLQSLLTERCRNCGKPRRACVCPRPAGTDFLFFYGSPLSKRLISLVKTGIDRREADFLAALLIDSAGIRAANYDAVTFVPRRKRVARRYGYDQAKELASALAKRLSLPLVPTLVRRGKNAQKLMSASERRKYSLKSYYARDDVPPEFINKRFLLVDDVATTGATLEACAKILRDSGIAAKVSAAVLANTELKNTEVLR